MTDTTSAAFYGRLTEALDAAGYSTTQSGIAKLMGLSQTAVSAWANEGSFPRMDHLIRFTELTGCSLDWQVTGRGSRGVAVTGEPDAEELLRLFRALRVDGRAFVIQAARIAAAAQRQ